MLTWLIEISDWVRCTHTPKKNVKAEMDINIAMAET